MIINLNNIEIKRERESFDLTLFYAALFYYYSTQGGNHPPLKSTFQTDFANFYRGLESIKG